MKQLSLLALLGLIALSAVSHAAPPRHVASKKHIRHSIKAVQVVPQLVPTVGPPTPLTSIPHAGNRPFPDVPPDHWAAAAVETLRQRGIVVGYPNGSPHP